MILKCAAGPSSWAGGGSSPDSAPAAVLGVVPQLVVDARASPAWAEPALPGRDRESSVVLSHLPRAKEPEPALERRPGFLSECTLASDGTPNSAGRRGGADLLIQEQSLNIQDNIDFDRQQPGRPISVPGRGRLYTASDRTGSGAAVSGRIKPGQA